MTGAARIALAAAAVMFAAPASAQAGTVGVNVEFQAFAPDQVDALPGDIVQWANESERRHTVTAGDGSFDSGDLLSGTQYSHEFDAVGSFPYHCTVHLGMTGEVDVRRVTLGPLPGAAIPAGQRVDFGGRTAGAGPVEVEQETSGGFRRVASALPGPDGSWHAAVTALVTSNYRAVSGADASETRRLLVTDRHVRIRATRHGVEVTVDPSLPGARIRIQRRLRERFGWWPSAARPLDYLSRATFAVRRPARVRAVLVDADGWTPVAISPVLTLRARHRR